jgi:hypothetical protein
MHVSKKATTITLSSRCAGLCSTVVVGVSVLAPGCAMLNISALSLNTSPLLLQTRKNIARVLYFACLPAQGGVDVNGPMLAPHLCLTSLCPTAQKFRLVSKW